jgi:HAD superfamily hydrolase (TIGR01509 family)
VYGLGLRKNDIVLARIRTVGVDVYPGSVAYVEAAKKAAWPCAVVSSSTNCKDVLTSAGIVDLFDEIVDGVVAEQQHLKGKPAPDTFLEAARRVGAEPAEAAVFEDALAGVAAGRAGKFGCVVGVDRVGQAGALLAHGANRVIQDLAELLDDGARP